MEGAGILCTTLFNASVLKRCNSLSATLRADAGCIVGQTLFGAGALTISGFFGAGARRILELVGGLGFYMDGGGGELPRSLYFS